MAALIAEKRGNVRKSVIAANGTKTRVAYGVLLATLLMRPAHSAELKTEILKFHVPDESERRLVVSVLDIDPIDREALADDKERHRFSFQRNIKVAHYPLGDDSGNLDLFVMESGLNFCGTAGCTLYIWHYTKEGWIKIANEHFDRVNYQLTVLGSRTYGFHDILNLISSTG